MKSDYYYVCNNTYMGMVVHRKGCQYLQKKEQAFLGSFYAYYQAVVVAKQRYAAIEQCATCLKFQR